MSEELREFVAAAVLVERIRERVEAMPCDRARYAPDVMEWFDNPQCVHCELLALIEGGRRD